jgi:hypothetical protein
MRPPLDTLDCSPSAVKGKRESKSVKETMRSVHRTRTLNFVALVFPMEISRPTVIRYRTEIRTSSLGDQTLTSSS